MKLVSWATSNGSKRAFLNNKSRSKTPLRHYQFFVSHFSRSVEKRGKEFTSIIIVRGFSFPLRFILHSEIYSGTSHSHILSRAKNSTHLEKGRFSFLFLHISETRSGRWGSTTCFVFLCLVFRCSPLLQCHRYTANIL